MMLYFDRLPGWHFEVRALSAGEYAFTGFRDGEQRLELTGTDTTALSEQCRQEAERLEGGPAATGGDARKPR